MSTGYNLPKALQRELIETHGKNIEAWPEELRDLMDSSITARNISPPISGKVEAILNSDYHYHWAEDRNGATPFHERVEGLKWAGWQFATTDDVRMASEDTVMGRDSKKQSKDGKGFSDEIRSGDRRLMKLPMRKWRESRKAQNIAAYQLAYPQPFGMDGKPMSAQNLIPGMRTEELDPAAITSERRRANSGNSVLAQTTHQAAQE
jgi:hypothetical protein